MLLAAQDAGRKNNRRPLVVALHARGQDAAGGIRFARADFGERPDILAPQAARPCNPFQSNLQSAEGYAGFSWYLGDDPARPEAASFGDALAQLEALVAPIRREYVLTGEGQGACLALALACYRPRRLLGVRIRSGAFPTIDGWDPPRSDSPWPFYPCTLLAAELEGSELDRTLQARGAEVLYDKAPVTPLDWLRILRESVTAGA